MKRPILLLLAALAFALPTTAMAESDFGGIGGVGTGFPGSLTLNAGGGFTITMELNSISDKGKTTTGALGTIIITIGPVAVCGPGEECFSTGTIDIASNSNVTLFQGTFTNGSFIQETCHNNKNVCIGINGFMSNGITVVDIVQANGVSRPGQVILSSNTISGAVAGPIPEPGTLGLMGTGFVTFVIGAVRRRNAMRSIS